ncbi:MAG TPA: SDR family NAD(P)-dependent oxidoreductase, partial [Paenibacillus cookii]|nr:SDR family NAD(P)-dependent oxidoreductase [Paenibacillus cookii]
MKKAIVLGATGGTGAAITAELVQRGVETVAFGRSRAKLEQLARQLGNPGHLRLSIGDAFRPGDVASAAGGAEVLFHCANVPYNEMAQKLVPLGES